MSLSIELAEMVVYGWTRPLFIECACSSMSAIHFALSVERSGLSLILSSGEVGAFRGMGLSSFRAFFKAILPNRRPMKARLNVTLPKTISCHIRQCFNIWETFIFPQWAV